MLTVSSADRDVADAMRYGAAGYLTKEVSPEALARAVRSTQTGELVMPRRLAGRLLARMSTHGLRTLSRDDAPEVALTRREHDVHRLLADGLTDRDIAVALTISRRTVETHVSSILHKLGAQNRTEAAAQYRDES
jgi:DNA-binding NarL/FixJ family response regulator